MVALRSQTLASGSPFPMGTFRISRPNPKGCVCPKQTLSRGFGRVGILQEIWKGDMDGATKDFSAAIPVVFFSECSVRVFETLQPTDLALLI